MAERDTRSEKLPKDVPGKVSSRKRGHRKYGISIAGFVWMFLWLNMFVTTGAALLNVGPLVTATVIDDKSSHGIAGAIEYTYHGHHHSHVGYSSGARIDKYDDVQVHLNPLPWMRWFGAIGPAGGGVWSMLFGMINQLFLTLILSAYPYYLVSTFVKRIRERRVHF